MEIEIKEMLEEQQIKIDQTYQTVEKIRKYMFWSLIGTLVFFLLPLLALIIIVPIVMNGYLSTLSGLGL